MASGKKAHLEALEASEEKRRLSKDQILRSRIVQDEVFIEALEGTVIIQSMSHGTRQELRDRAKWGSPEYDDDLFTMLGIVYSVIDPDLTEEDVKALKEQDVRVIDQLVAKISALNMFGKSEELKKE